MATGQGTVGGAVLPASFRDPSGFVFTRDGALLRQVGSRYRAHYDALLASGLYRELVDAELLIPHDEVSTTHALEPGAYRVLRPEPVPFISYPYEWCFGQLRDAALTVLRIQREALTRGMVLKDASAYNVQFHRGRPVLIDTLSFELYREGEPWIAYRQFCQHFLAPLLLMAHVDSRMSQLLRAHIDGVPLDLAAALLPWKTRLRPGALLHVHLHARSLKKHAHGRPGAHRGAGRVSRTGMSALIDSLEAAVRGVRWEPVGTEWADYTETNRYGQTGRREKHRLVRELLGGLPGAPALVWDLGANTGEFSRRAAELGATVVAFDMDPAAVEINYRRTRREGERQILPLLMDLTNPSPALGWDHRERDSLVQRGEADVVLALALVHHLAITNNVPLPRIAGFLARLAPYLVVEFVPRSDEQVQRLLASREDVFEGYTPEGFQLAFETQFETVRAETIPGTERRLCLMRRKRV